MKLPTELHVYDATGGVSRICLRNDAGEELDLTLWGVTEATRCIRPGELPICEVKFIARLVEHPKAET